MDIAALLNQARVWQDGMGRYIEIEAMDRHHRANLIPILRCNALTIANAAPVDVTCTAEAEEWLEQTPLMRRLVDLERGRPIDDRRVTHERNVAFERATGYRKVRLG